MRKAMGSFSTLGLCLALAAAGCGGGGGSGSGPAPPPNPLFVSAQRGNDTNVGNIDQPLATITKAASIAQNGYTIYVGAGTYGGEIKTAAVGAAPQGLQIIADPTGAQTGDSPGAVIVNAQGQGNGFSLGSVGCLGTTCGLIDGFVVTGASSAAIAVKSGSTGFTVQNCIVHDNTNADGINVQDSANVLIFNNLVYNNGRRGLVIAGTITGSPNARVFSNTIVNNNDHGLNIGSTCSAPPAPCNASPHATVLNNIIQNNDITKPPENLKVFTSPRSDLSYAGDFNLVFPANYDPANIKGMHDLNVDADFVNTATSDFHLRTGSSAIDAGTALNLPDPELNAFRARTTTGRGADTGVLDLGFHFLPH